MISVFLVGLATYIVFSNFHLIFGLLKPSPTFEIIPSSSSIIICSYKGCEKTVNFTLRSINGFQSVVSLELERSIGTTGGLRTEVFPVLLDLTSCNEAEGVLIISANYGLLEGEHYVDINAKGGGCEKSVRIRITVND